MHITNFNENVGKLRTIPVDKEIDNENVGKLRTIHVRVDINRALKTIILFYIPSNAV